MVEEIFDHSSNGAILGHHDPCFPTSVRGLRLPESFRLVDWYACSYVLLLVQGILQTILHETETKGMNKYTD